MGDPPMPHCWPMTAFKRPPIRAHARFGGITFLLRGVLDLLPGILDIFARTFHGAATREGEEACRKRGEHGGFEEAAREQ